MEKTKREAIKFFAEHAVYCTPPGRMACAKALAEAEAMAQDLELTVDWETDYDADTSWMDAKQLKQFEDGTLVPYYARVFNAERDYVLAALGGIFMLNTGDAYSRVVEAELFQEAIAELKRAA